MPQWDARQAPSIAYEIRQSPLVGQLVDYVWEDPSYLGGQVFVLGEAWRQPESRLPSILQAVHGFLRRT